MPLDEATKEAMREQLLAAGLTEEEVESRLDDYELEAGGFAEDFTGTITEPRFESGEYGIQLACTIIVDEIIEPPDVDYEKQPVWWSCGDGWQLSDSMGSAIESLKGRRKIRTSSKYGHLLARTHEELQVPLHLRGSPLEAAIWDGLRFHFIREYEEVPPRLRREGQAEQYATVLPKQWLQDALPGQTASATPAPAAPVRAVRDRVARAVQPPKNENPYVDILEDPTVVKFLDAAVGKTSREAIVAAMRVPEIRDDDSFCALLTDETQYPLLIAALDIGGLAKMGPDGKIWRIAKEK